MASSASWGSGRAAGSLFRLVMLAAGFASVLPRAAQAQDVERSEYRTAESAYNFALNSRYLAYDLYNQAIAETTDARNSGDEERFDRALAVFQESAKELELSNRLLAEAGDELEQARRAYLERVQDHVDELYEELPRIADESDRTLVLRRIDNLTYEADLLARPVETDYDPFPEITIDPRDTREEIRAKAEVLERQAARDGDLLLDIDAQIESYERRRRHARMWQDFGADLFRFDDLQVPVGTPDAASDNTIGLIGNEELSQRLEELNRSREFLTQRRNIATARAQEFRRRSGGEFV